MSFFFLLAKCKFLITDALAPKTRGPRENKQKDREMKTRAGKFFLPARPDTVSKGFFERFLRGNSLLPFGIFYEVCSFHKIPSPVTTSQTHRSRSENKTKKEKKSSEMKKTNFLHELSHRVEHRGMYVLFMSALC